MATIGDDLVRLISRTVLFSPVDRLFKMAYNTVLRGGYL